MLKVNKTIDYPNYCNMGELFKKNTITNNLLSNIRNNLSTYFLSDRMLEFYIDKVLNEDIVIDDKTGKVLCNRVSLITDYVIKCCEFWGTPVLIKSSIYYVYNGKYYLKNKDIFNRSFIEEVLNGVGSPVSTRKIKDIKDLEEKFKGIEMMEDKTIDNYINLNNGTILFNNDGNFSLIPHSPKNHIFYCLDYNYERNATCEDFLKFLRSSIPDQESRRVLQEYLGWCLLKSNSKSTKFEKALFLIGRGSNGKSVIYEIINAVFGKINVSSLQLSELTTNSNARMSAKDCFINFCSDTERGGKIEHGVLKAMISGESVTFKSMRQNIFTQDWEPKLIFNANSMPSHTEFTDAFFRRLIVIPFEVQFTGKDIDMGIADRVIKNELPGVLNWLIQGLQRLLINKRFSKCEKSEKYVGNYKNESDTVSLWLLEKGITKSDTFNLESVNGQVLYEKFCHYCAVSGIKRFVPSKQKFYKRLDEDFNFLSRVNRGSKEYYLNVEDRHYFTRVML